MEIGGKERKPKEEERKQGRGRRDNKEKGGGQRGEKRGSLRGRIACKQDDHTSIHTVEEWLL